MNKLIKPNAVVKKVIIYKDDNFDDESRGMECKCYLIFEDGQEVSYIMNGSGDFDLLDDDDKYHRGVYEYVDGEYKQIEDWD